MFLPSSGLGTHGALTTRRNVRTSGLGIDGPPIAYLPSDLPRLWPPMRLIRFAAILTVAFATGCGGRPTDDGSADDSIPPEQLVEPVARKDIPPSPVLTPAEALADFRVEDGFTIELVASEPEVVAPVALTFDANGAMWVVEMRGYMNHLDGSGEEVPNGRVRVLRDTDNDGSFETVTTFLDGLVLPRAIAMTKGGILLAEPPNLLFVENDNYVAGKRVIVDSAYAVGGNPEHQPNGLLHAMDNWIYSATSDVRYRLVDGGWLRDSTQFRGQWGITQDDFGRLFYNHNSATLLGDNVLPNDFPANPNHEATHANYSSPKASNRVYTRRVNPGVNRAYLDGTLGDDGHLANVTGACGPVIYRENAFPASHHGNAFVMEPTGNVVMRVVLEDRDGVVEGAAPYEGREFLSSTDERFRPVNGYVGPDGALYVVDMYRGVIQHATYLTPYLRRQIERRDLATPLDLGRIYRIRWADPGRSDSDRPAAERPAAERTAAERAGAPRLLDMATSDLVAELRNPAGWWRDTAQRLLVQTADPEAPPALRRLIATRESSVTIIHALWTLEGLRVLSVDDLNDALRVSQSAKVHATVLRLAATLADSPDVSTRRRAYELVRSTPDTGREVDLQRVLALQQFLDLDEDTVFDDLLRAVAERRGSAEFVDAVLGGLHGREDRFQLFAETRRSVAPELYAAVVQARFTSQVGPVLAALALEGDRAESYTQGASLYRVHCASCHGPDGRGLPALAPTLRRSEWVLQDPETPTRIVLDGVAGPIRVNGLVVQPPDTPGLMPGLSAPATLSDGDIADVLTYIRNTWGNRAPAVDSGLVAAVRSATQHHAGTPYTADELVALRSEGSQLLTPGADLSGWEKLGGTATFEVVGDEVIGTTVAGSPNTFLATEQTYDDFILEFEVKVDPQINSGVQIRSLSLPEYENGVVHGYQIEIDPSDRAWSGGIYDESRRGWLFDLRGNPAARAAFRVDGWNHYRVEARGPHIRTWVNGVLAADLLDDMTPSGFIALQVHSVGSPDLVGREVRWRGLRLMGDQGR